MVVLIAEVSSLKKKKKNGGKSMPLTGEYLGIVRVVMKSNG